MSHSRKYCLVFLLLLLTSCASSSNDQDRPDSSASFSDLTDSADTPFVFHHGAWPLHAAYRNGRIHLSTDGHRESLSIDLPRLVAQAGRKTDLKQFACDDPPSKDCLHLQTTDYQLDLSGNASGVHLRFTIDEAAPANTISLIWSWKGEDLEAVLNPTIDRVEFQRDGKSLLALQVHEATDATGREISASLSIDKNVSPALRLANDDMGALSFPLSISCEIVYPVLAWQVEEDDAWNYSYGAYLDKVNHRILVSGKTYDEEQGEIVATLSSYNENGEKESYDLFSFSEGDRHYFHKILKSTSSIYLMGGSDNYDTGITKLGIASFDYTTGFQWSFLYDCPDDSCEGEAFLESSTGNLMAVGTVYNGSSSRRSMIYAVDNTGYLIWDDIPELGDPYCLDSCLYTNAVADNSGNIYVAGALQNSDLPFISAWDLLLVKYNIGGIHEWEMIYDNDFHTIESPVALQLSSENDLLLLINVIDPGTTDIDIYRDIEFLKYNQEGDLQWVYHYGDTGISEESVAFQQDNSGNIYLAGNAYDSKGQSALLIIKLNSQGVEQWVERYYNPDCFSLFSYSITADSEHNIYVAGGEGDGSESNFLVKYDDLGHQKWTLDENYTVSLFGTIEMLLSFDLNNNLYHAMAEPKLILNKIVECDGCYIQGACYSSGDINQDNSCQFCDPEQSQSEWSLFADGVLCDDKIWCNGNDECADGTCSIHSGSPCSDDGIYCNGVETCVEDTDSCGHAGDPCDDGLWCNGTETCLEESDSCQSGTSRCTDDGIFCNGTEICLENTDECSHTDDPCNDGLWCNGLETCDEENDDCQSGTAPCPDDGIWCNGEETCDESSDSCQHHNAPCPDDNLFCNGVETCDESNRECVSGTNPCPDDNLFCDGQEFCDENTDECGSTGDPCEANQTCLESTDECRNIDDDNDDISPDDDSLDDDVTPHDDDSSSDNDSPGDDDLLPDDDNNDIDKDDSDGIDTMQKGSCGCS